MESLKVVGLTGKSGSGKDLVAAMMRQHGFKRVAFADELRKEVVRALLSGQRAPRVLDSDLRDFWDAKALDANDVWRKPTSPSMRRLLQQWGTEYRRSEDPEYWVKRARDYVPELAQDSDTKGIVVSDVRFPNEARWILEQGGSIWKIHRPDLVVDDDHVSEVPLDECYIDRTIRNDGGLMILAERVLAALRWLK